MSVQRHKEHVSTSLVRAEEVRQDGLLAATADNFYEASLRLRKLLDACDEWLTDPEEPGRYTLEPRAGETTVLYLTANEKGKMVQRRKTLQECLDLIEGRLGPVQMVETKRADPRKLLVDVANSLDGKLGTFLKAWEMKQEQDRERAALAAQADTDTELRDLIAETLPEEALREGIEQALAEPLGPKVAGRVAAVLAPTLGAWIAEQFAGEGGEG